MLEKKTLPGRFIRLEPLSEVHASGLRDAVSDGELWKLFVTLVPNVDEIDSFIRDAVADYEAGDGLAFALIELASGRVAGSTRFMRTNLPHRRIEIGFTFLGRSWQRTALNTEAKLLMLTHAFESLEMIRVEFLTDYLNARSRQAILRLGAKEEGVLRNHMVMPDGRVRDSVLYSVIRNEWPGVKRNLREKLA